MSYVIAAPEIMTSAAADLAAIGSNVSAAHLVAAAPTTSVIPAAADEVSASIAHLFSQHAANYQAMAAQAAGFQEQFVQHLTASAGAFARAEAANVALLQPLTASAGAIGSAIGALPGQLLNSFNDFLGLYATFAFDVPVFIHDLLLAALNFFVFLINSGVPLALFGVPIFPGLLATPIPFPA
jgi:hypothetical protein